jgi:hypothetical protein
VTGIILLGVLELEGVAMVRTKKNWKKQENWQIQERMEKKRAKSNRIGILTMV